MRNFTLFLVFLHLFSLSSLAATLPDKQDEAVKTLWGNQSDKFTNHEPIYVIGGDDDLKLQFSFKYRLSQDWNFYFAYTQLMFWNIYDESKPFRDVNYRPEVFYRLFTQERGFFQNLDVGYVHYSNGQDELNSRSVERVFLRSTIATRIRRHLLGGTIGIQYLFDEDKTNKDLINHFGYWEARGFLTDVILVNDHRIDFNFRVNAGSKIIDFDKGSYEVGLTYKFSNTAFNPGIYLQRYEGYGENLLHYDRKRVEHRIGLIVTY